LKGEKLEELDGYAKKLKKKLEAHAVLIQKATDLAVITPELNKRIIKLESTVDTNLL
jgi:hypothetical protein